MLPLTELPRRLVRMVTRHYPLMSGCGTLANTAPFKALATLGPARATAKLEGGVRRRTSTRSRCPDCAC